MRHRGILTVLVSAALLAAAVITAAVLLYPQLPDPEHATQRELLRWLVTRDLRQVPTATREALALRLEEEFSGEIDWSATASELTDAQRRRLCENVPLLMAPWMHVKASRYASLSAGDRPVYLDHLIDTLQQWRGLDSLMPPPSAGEGDRPGLMTSALAELSAMQDQAAADQQREMHEFMLALRTRWAMRELARRIQASADSWFSR